MTISPVRRDDSTAEFLDGTAVGEFRLRRSRVTGEILGPQFVTDSAGSTDLEWIVAAGTGTVVSWVVSHGKARDGVEPPVAVIAIVELSEGPWWWCELPGADPAQLRVGLPVRAEFVRPEGSEEVVPVFRVV